jgi:outer membrane translocation and assembly module TamA
VGKQLCGSRKPRRRLRLPHTRPTTQGNWQLLDDQSPIRVRLVFASADTARAETGAAKLARLSRFQASQERSSPTKKFLFERDNASPPSNNGVRKEKVEMIIGVPREIKESEYRVAMVPAGVEILTKAGHTVLIETGAGKGTGITDEEYAQAGARIVPMLRPSSLSPRW